MLLPYRKHYNDDRLLLDMLDGERGRDIGTLEVFLQLSKYEIYAIRYDREAGVEQCILRLVDSKSRILRESGGAVVKALDHQCRQNLLRLALRLAPLFAVRRSRWWVEDEVGTADDEVPRWLLSAIHDACGAHNNVVIVDGEYRMTRDDVIDLSKRMVRWRAAAAADVPPVLPQNVADFTALQLEQELAERELAEAATALEEVLRTEDYDAATRLSQRVDCAIARARIGAARIDEAMRAAQVLMGGDLVEDAGEIGWPWLPTPGQARWREAGDVIWDIERSQRKVDDIREALGADGHVDEALQVALDELHGYEEAYDTLRPEGIDGGIREWYLAEHPDEADGCPIPADATFADLDREYSRGGDYWAVLGGWGWSDDRQALGDRCLDQLAEMWGVKYDDMLARHLDHM